MSSFNLNTYVIGGPENIQERHLLPSETKSEALVRFVDIFSSLGLDVFQLRFKNSSDDDFLKLANEIVQVLKNTNCKINKWIIIFFISAPLKSFNEVKHKVFVVIKTKLC